MTQYLVDRQEQTFQLWAYTVSMGRLLLRSTEHPPVGRTPRIGGSPCRGFEDPQALTSGELGFPHELRGVCCRGEVCVSSWRP